ncbi:MAG TPA: SDR family oxidoreductase [Thermoleophilaceae bacterium]|nr:SDR family oxidoreductase [Thermoleophilaceae bacterium]
MGAVLLTGATGFVGKEILDRFLERGRRVFALVRARDDDAAAERLPRHALLTPVAGDIERPRLGLSEPRAAGLAQDVTTVLHCAASVSFDLSLADSRRVNVDGTRHVLELAERLPRLDRLSYVSTAYVAGEPRGLFREHELDVGQRFRNPYERSKFEAERMVRERADGLPLQVLRPSIVVGDSRTGRTTSFNVLYGPLKAIARGAIPAIPARRSSPVDIVPVDYVADRAVDLAQGGPDGTFHLVAGRNATTVGRLLELASAQLGRKPPAVLPPAAYRCLVHPLLRRKYTGLRRMEVYFPYFSMRVRFDDRRLGPAPPVETYFHRLVDFAQRARWGVRKT